MTSPIQNRKFWYCPNCAANAATVTDRIPHHPCPRQHGVMTPLVRHGVKAKVEAIERQDYVGKATVLLDSRGVPISSVVTTRDDGQDVSVFPDTATAGRED